MVCVYEGKEEETFHGKRRVLTNCHYFCGVNSKEANLKFWDDIYQYLERNYDLDQVKKIYLNADGGSWIKTGAKRCPKSGFGFLFTASSVGMGRMSMDSMRLRSKSDRSEIISSSI